MPFGKWNPSPLCHHHSMGPTSILSRTVKASMSFPFDGKGFKKKQFVLMVRVSSQGQVIALTNKQIYRRSFFLKLDED